MTVLREDMAARPLNADLTPETFKAVSERCRDLRVNKKDIVEVLLRTWLEAETGSKLEFAALGGRDQVEPVAA